MHTQRPGLLMAALAILAMLAPAAGPVLAAGIGIPLGPAVLGQPLNLAVPVQWDDGEPAPAPARCIQAEVTIGDRRLPTSAVFTRLEALSADRATVRVQSRVAVDEPVVSVVLNVGCQARVSRSFVVLADPPGLANLPAGPAGLPMLAPALALAPPQEAALDGGTNGGTNAGSNGGTNAGSNAGSSGGSNAGPGFASNAGTSAAVAPARPTASARPRTKPQAPTVSRTSTTARTRAPATSSGQARGATQGKAAAATRVASAARPLAKTVAAPAPRLQLDSSGEAEGQTASSAGQLQAVEQALLAVSNAASAVRAANSAASAAEQRALGLERSLAQLQAENRTQRDSAALMRERLSRAAASSDWLWPLIIGLLALAALAAWLTWQLVGLRRQQRQGWQKAAQAAVGPGQGTAAGRQALAPLPFVTAGVTAGRTPQASPSPASSAVLPPRSPPSPPPARVPAAPVWPPPAPAEPLSEPMFDTGPQTLADDRFSVSTQPSLVDLAPVPNLQRSLPPSTLPVAPLRSAAPAAARDLSIEELIDLEQQAEFFVVLGQDEAAIELLVEHLRSTGGGSPLPYLKLLEIYQRKGDAEAYERTRTQFNQRFNAYAAEWTTGLLQGRRLEDYPDVLPRLVQAWPQPLDAMAELEALLFRKSHGELFDLPAYREVLFLYALARDLLDREAADTGQVDLLLPLADGGDFGVTSPHPYFGLEHDSVFDRQAAEPRTDDRSTAPVDLDLTQSELAQRIVDPLAARRPGP